MNNHITYHSSIDLYDYFYNKTLLNALRNMDAFVGSGHDIHVFSEATLKKNNYPNGVLMQSLQDQTVLLPALLRDPGCGFLVFMINDVCSQQLPELAEVVLRFCQKLEKSIPTLPRDTLSNALQYGVSHQPSKTVSHFAQKCFAMADTGLIEQLDPTLLATDLHQITNSLELKITSQTNTTESSEVIGVLHSGSDYIPLAMQRYWFRTLVHHCVQDDLASIEDILDTSLYGIRDTSPIAPAYRQWVNAAMNFCLFKRGYIFNLLHQELTKHGYQTLHISDRCHAGLFETTINNHRYWIQSRGVQVVDHQALPYVIAGQRESRSYLANPQNTDLQPAFLGHGTSYRVDKRLNYPDLLGEQHSRACIQQLNRIHANTRLDVKNCLAYEYNIVMQQNYLKNLDVDVRSLLPYVNYQGRYLRGAK